MTTLTQLNKIIEKYPLLTREQENKLADTIKNGSEKKAKQALDTLVQSNIRLVIKIVNDEHSTSQDRDDLVSEGIIGLQMAASRYKSEVGAKFSTYAGWYIRQRIFKYIQNSKPIHLTSGMNLAYNRVMRITESLKDELGYMPSNEEISEITGVTIKRLEELQGYSFNFIPLDEPVSRGEEGSKTMTVSDIVEDKNAIRPDKAAERNVDLESHAEALKHILDELPKREKEILHRRFGFGGKDPETLESIGKTFKVSRERIRQLQELALKKVRKEYKNAVESSYCLN